jgi:hypothetical protein
MGKKKEPPPDFDQQLEAMERKIDRLRVLYDQFFMGIEKQPPTNLQRDVVRTLNDLGQYHIRKTTHKFRFNGLRQRFSVNKAYWMRMERRMEEGTLKRDRDRAARRSLIRHGEKIDAAELAKRLQLQKTLGDDALAARCARSVAAVATLADEHEDYVPAAVRGHERRIKRRKRADKIRGAPAREVADRVADASSVPAAKPAARKREPGPEPFQLLWNAGVTPDRVQEVYAEFISAREQAGQSVRNLSYEKMVQSMAKQASKVQKSHNASEIDFHVVTKKGKVFIKPQPK